VNDSERHLLGFGTPITRRDFLNGTLLGTAGLIAGGYPVQRAEAAVDTFTGYGGVGDYRYANGNTWPVVQAAHRLRDAQYDAAAYAKAVPAGDYDLIVVGGGIVGLSAAYYFLKAAGGRRRILLLENHPIVGGEARQNEFLVDGSFDPGRDIAAIVLNRWGHARLIEPPGFHYGVDGKPSPLERVREGYGRVAIGHAELNGTQHWGSALEYGKRAGERAAVIGGFT
jgi:hypothetical protein